jgi:glucokinase
MKILCGDIGGTKTLLQLAEVNGGQINVIDQHRYLSNNYADFYMIVSDFLANHLDIKIHSACFGVAGPVFQSTNGQSATITNLPWQIDTVTLARRFQINSATIINDFQAVGYGLDALSDDDFVTLQVGEPISPANQLVIGAGTGLGVAQRIWDDNHYRVIATEGGHADFAPATELQLKLAAFLISRFGRCSIEHVVSGPGLVNVYSFLAEQQNQQATSHYQAIISSDDPAAAISQSAQAKQKLAIDAIELFVEAYGTQAGNFALSSLALGGVYIAGGIAPKLIEFIQAPPFMEAFRKKGKMVGLMGQMPVRVVINAEVGLLGSRVIAERNLPSR